MKKPSVDFNAMAPNFLNKISSRNAKDYEEQKDGQGKKKSASSKLWSMATSLKKMVTKRLYTTSAKHASE